MDRKIQEIYEIDGRIFIIKKFPAAESMSVLKELLSKSLPIDLFSMMNVGGKNLGQTLREYGLGNSNKNQMSIDEFTDLQMRLMKCVQERLKGGDESVIDNLGNYKVEDLEYNLELFSSLLLKVVSVNYKDFFIEKMKKLGLLEKIEEMEDNQMKELAKSFLE